MNKIQNVSDVIMHARNALVIMIIHVLNVQMDFFQMKHLLLKALKNVSRHALQELN